MSLYFLLALMLFPAGAPLGQNSFYSHSHKSGNGFSAISLYVIPAFAGMTVESFPLQRHAEQVQSGDDRYREDTHITAGNRLYQEQKFEEALSAYKEALAAGAASGPLFYNLGNAYYRMGQVGEAVRYYMKASRLMPGSQRVSHNLAIVRSQIDQPIPRLPLPFWERWWHALVTTIGAKGLFLVGLIAYLPAVGLMGYRIWAGGLPHSLRRVRHFLIGLAVAGFATGLLASWQQTTDHRAVITAPDASLYRDPATASAVERQVPEGTVVNVTEDLREWQRVVLPNGVAGWVREDAAGNI